jgi:hypothetical protein
MAAPSATTPGVVYERNVVVIGGGPIRELHFPKR